MGVVSVVESDKGVRDVLIKLLRSPGIDAHGFASGAEYLLFDRRQQATCLIVDAWLSDMAGIKLPTFLRQGGNCPPVIYFFIPDGNGCPIDQSTIPGAIGVFE